MRGTVKWFNSERGYGFLTDAECNDHFFHHSNIVMEGFRALDTDDVVEFEIGTGKKDREQAVNVCPVLTREMVRHELEKEDLQLVKMNDAFGNLAFMVVDMNNVIQTGDKGMSLIEVAAYTGIDTEGVVGED